MEEDTLIHYGVLGMKWGVRKQKRSANRQIKKASKREKTKNKLVKKYGSAENAKNKIAKKALAKAKAKTLAKRGLALTTSVLSGYLSLKLGDGLFKDFKDSAELGRASYESLNAGDAWMRTFLLGKMHGSIEGGASVGLLGLSVSSLKSALTSKKKVSKRDKRKLNSLK